MAATPQINAVGRRKTATARVYIRPGSGDIVVNRRPINSYFKQDTRRRTVGLPLNVTESRGSWDVLVNVKGGGLSGQAEAIQLGIARALVKVDEQHRSALRAAGLLTRDPRMVERKKYGQPKARKRFQFSKR